MTTISLEAATIARDNAVARREDISKIMEALNVVSDTAFDSAFLTDEDRAAVALSHRAPTWLALNEIRMRLDGEIREYEALVVSLSAAVEVAA